MAGLKKAYSAGSQALMQMSIDNGSPGDLGATGLFASGNLENAGDALAAQFKVVKNCGINTNQGCWVPVAMNIDGTGSFGNLDELAFYYKFITADGMSFALVSNGNNCTTDWGRTPNSPSTKQCGTLYIDTNSLKGPNALGRDVWHFKITSNKTPILYPYAGRDYHSGGSSSGATEADQYWNYNNKNGCSESQKAGHDCAGRVLEKGTMDY